jgi:hypothetical protein
LSGLHFASVALFTEGEVEVVAVEADPVALSWLCCSFDVFVGAWYLLDRSEVVIHRFKI